MRLQFVNHLNSQYATIKFIVGMTDVGQISITKEKERLYLCNFWIKREYRNKGFGLKAMKRITQFYNNHNMYLDVLQDNRTAIKIYEKVGFCISVNIPKFLEGYAYRMVKKQKLIQ